MHVKDLFYISPNYCHHVISNPREEERAETDSTGFLTVEFDPDLTVRKQWGLY